MQARAARGELRHSAYLRNLDSRLGERIRELEASLGERPDLRTQLAIQLGVQSSALEQATDESRSPEQRAAALRDAAAMLWERTDLAPRDVDCAQLYDGFSFITLAWLEALGFCAKGEGGSFIEGGARIARDGEIPLNTHGGQLSAGRLHGYGFLHEACVQLWGEGGDRQVGGDPQVAVAAAGGGPLGGCLLLRKG